MTESKKLCVEMFEAVIEKYKKKDDKLGKSFEKLYDKQKLYFENCIAIPAGLVEG